MIFGIVGKARSGKDTFADFLSKALYERTHKTFIQMAYAKTLKDRIQADFDLSWEQLWGDEKEIPDKRYGKPKAEFEKHMLNSKREEPINWFWTPREIMQAYGQFFRTIDYDFWVKELFRVMEDKEFENVIITDIRHPNEADPVKERKGYIINIQSEREITNTVHNQQHISETAMDGYKKVDFIVANNGTLQDLRKAAGDVVDQVFKTMEADNG